MHRAINEDAQVWMHGEGGVIVTVIFCGAAWFLAPKGENQTYVPNR
jgi:hypothetical protein